MEKSIKQAELALTLLGGVALRLQRTRFMKAISGAGTGSSVPPTHPRYDYVRHHTFRSYDYRAFNPYGYVPGWSYYFGPSIGLWGPNVVIGN